jgi:hypothetical protein
MSEDEKEEEGEKAIVVRLPLRGELSLSQKAFDFLANAPAEAVAAIFPGWDGRRRMTRAMAERLAELIRGDAEHEGPADALLLQAWRTQFERERNVVQTVEHATQLRDGGYSLNPNRALSPGNDNQPGATPPEWFARWRREAEDVTSDAMRNVYAKLLAGELESPTAFSMRTLSVVRDLDQRVAQLFELLEPLTLLGGVAIPSLQHLMSTTAFQPLGMKPIKMMSLRDAGLITSAQDAVIDVGLTPFDDGTHVTAMWNGHEWYRFRLRWN